MCSQQFVSFPFLLHDPDYDDEMRRKTWMLNCKDFSNLHPFLVLPHITIEKGINVFSVNLTSSHREKSNQDDECCYNNELLLRESRNILPVAFFDRFLIPQSLHWRLITRSVRRRMSRVDLSKLSLTKLSATCFAYERNQTKTSAIKSYETISKLSQNYL